MLSLWFLNTSFQKGITRTSNNIFRLMFCIIIKVEMLQWENTRIIMIRGHKIQTHDKRCTTSNDEMTDTSRPLDPRWPERGCQFCSCIQAPTMGRGVKMKRDLQISEGMTVTYGGNAKNNNVLPNLSRNVSSCIGLCKWNHLAKNSPSTQQGNAIM